MYSHTNLMHFYIVITGTLQASLLTLPQSQSVPMITPSLHLSLPFHTHTHTYVHTYFASLAAAAGACGGGGWGVQH